MMKRLAAFLAGVMLLGAASTTRSEIASRGFLLGTWRCTFTAGKEGGYYTTTWSLVLNGLWLKQTYDQPRQPHASPFKAEYLVGYNEDRQQWVRFGAMTTGQYFTIRMTDTGNGSWGWQYVSLFPTKGSAASGYDTVFTRRNDNLYTVDGPTYRDESGETVTEHHVCRKSDSRPRPIS